MKRIWLTILTFIGYASLLLGQEFSAFVSKQQVPLGEVFQVTFELKDARGGTPEYPDFKDFQVRGGPNFQQSVQMVNGQVSQSVSYTFYLQGTRTGTFTIGRASLQIDGKTLRTEPIQVKIIPARSNSSSNDPSQRNDQNARNRDIEEQLADAVFVRALVSDRDVYQGEQFTVSYKLYERVQTFDLRPEGNPSYEGFWVENIDIRNPVPRMEVVNGKQYRTYVIKKDILFPQRPGELTVDPLELTCVVRVRSASKRRRSIFDSFFGQYENYKYSFASAPVRIDVKALPTGRPADFSGVVGDLYLDVSLDTFTVETGEPLTLRVKLSGRGNIKKLQEPRLQFPPDFEVYDPNVTESISRNNGVLSGTRSYEYLIIPRNPGEYRIPAITYSFFNPQSGRYETQNSPEFNVKVTGEPQQMSSSSTPAQPGQKTDLALLGQDIRFIHPPTGDLRPVGSTFLLSWQYWLLYLIPVLAIAVLWIVKRRQMQDRRDVAGARRRKAAKMAKKRLSSAQQHLKAGQEKAFYDEVVRAMWGYLGNKFNLGQSEMSRERAAQLLKQQGADETLIERLHRLIDTCEMALFAPSAAPGGMQGTYDQAVELIADLEDIRITSNATV